MLIFLCVLSFLYLYRAGDPEGLLEDELFKLDTAVDLFEENVDVVVDLLDARDDKAVLLFDVVVVNKFDIFSSSFL